MQSVLKNRIPQLFFYSTIILLPFQLGYHFWPPFSFVSGLRVDYLSPTLYVSDLAIGGFLLSVILEKLKNRPVKITIKNYLWPIVFLVVVISGILFSFNPLAGFYQLFKLIEFSLFAIFVAHSKDVQMKVVAYCFVIGSFVESILAIVQFYQQSSVGGLLYFLGERTFSSETPGIANASIFGSLVLRPYGTLPHPNVLAGYLLFCSVAFFFYRTLFVSQKEKVLLYSMLLLSAIGIVLAMSRTIWLLYVLIGMCLLIQSHFSFKKTWFFVAIGALVALLVGSMFGGRFAHVLTDESTTQRIDLAKAAFRMYHHSPLFGVGLNNFFNNLSYALPPRNLFLLQPVHNIFLLILAETGALGFSLVGIFIAKTYARILSQSKNHQFFFVLVSIAALGIGMIDHYFLTVQQGQLLLALLLGLMWNKTLKL